MTAKEAREELEYCLRLAKQGTTPEVGGAVEAYLRVQAAGARMDERTIDAAVYAQAADYWKAGQRAHAVACIAERCGEEC
jgi:hypothetical protein